MTFRDGINKGDAYFDWNTYTYIDPNAGNTTGLNDGVITSADIMQINSYYPFGLNMEGNWNGSQGGNKYQYNGKEWNDDFGLGWNDYGARFYDPAIYRWLSVDPLAEKHANNSPYVYTLNNPVKYIDPDGMDNILYILTLKNVSAELVDNAIAKANEYMRTMGLNTLVMRATNNFDLSKLDDTDGMVLIGNDKQQVISYLNSNDNLKNVINDKIFLTYDVNKEWTSSDSETFPEVTSKKLGVVAIDGLDGFRNLLKCKFSDGSPLESIAMKTNAEALGFIIVHSMGHQAGSIHKDGQVGIELAKGFMADGPQLIQLFSGSRGNWKTTPVSSMQQIFNGDTTNNSGKPRTEPEVIEQLKHRFQPNNQPSKDNANH